MVVEGAAADGCQRAVTILAALPGELRAGLTYAYRTFVKELPANVRALPAARELSGSLARSPA